mgnify:CR=1 FL=1
MRSVRVETSDGGVRTICIDREEKRKGEFVKHGKEMDKAQAQAKKAGAKL